MNPRSPLKCILIVAVLAALSACATDYAAQLYRPNFGRPALNGDENVDSRLLMNGIYAARPFGANPYATSPYESPCLTAEYRCSQQTQSAWSSFDP